MPVIFSIGFIAMSGISVTPRSQLLYIAVFIHSTSRIFRALRKYSACGQLSAHCWKIACLVSLFMIILFENISNEC